MVRVPRVVLVASLLVLAGCGDADRPLKAKNGETDRATAAVRSEAPSAAKGWSFFPYDWETAHPYANREHQVFTITHPGAANIRLHLRSFHTESGYDWVKVSSIDGGSAISYSGRLEDFWTESIPGSTVRVEFVTDGSITRDGFAVDQYAVQLDGEEWNTRSFVWETAHPYTDDTYRVIEVSEPEAVKIKLLFGEFRTERGYDFVKVYDETGRLLVEYSGDLGKFETPAFPGRKLYVAFESDYSVTDWGVSLAQVSYVAEADEPGCICTQQYAPVCGVNGKTYGNACFAACEEAAIAHPGECGVTGDFCGGIAALPCGEGLRCEPEGSWPDAGGVCVE